jgi:DNA-binding PadR family transcriptional regulator
LAYKGDINALILGTLKNEPLHGYEIVRRIRHGGFARRLSEGQIYPFFHELEGAGLLSSEWVNDEEARPRRVYEITKSGIEEFVRPRSLWERICEGWRSLSVNGLKTMEVANA